MIYLALTLYFLLMVAAAAVLLLPDVRQRVFTTARTHWHRVGAA